MGTAIYRIQFELWKTPDTFTHIPKINEMTVG